MNKNLNQTKKWKNIFKNLRIENIEYINTEGNFILLKSQNYEFHKRLFLNNNILPKMDFPQLYLKDCFRFSVFNDRIMHKLVDIIRRK